MSTSTLQADLMELEAAEDFLEYFGIPYDPAVVQVNRLHILQRFHDYLQQTPVPEDKEQQATLYKSLLQQAYQDFVESDALTEKVFKIFQRQEPQEVYIPLDRIQRRG
ncbi:MAG: nitrogenase-stabilizing/protective protein NifW [Candidatus Competibacteraceae bacterium]